MDKLDYKKAYKELYFPKSTPSLIQVPGMTFIQVTGKGDPNTCQEYKDAIEILYGLSWGIKMNRKGEERPEGYFEYTVFPLEGMWQLEDTSIEGGIIRDKNNFKWISMIRQPDFVTPQVFEKAKERLLKKKPDTDFTNTRLAVYEEGLCCQVMHTGPFDEEAASIEKLEAYIREAGYETDITEVRQHHEIYLSDFRRTAPERMKTVIRHPVKVKLLVTP